MTLISLLQEQQKLNESVAKTVEMLSDKIIILEKRLRKLEGLQSHESESKK